VSEPNWTHRVLWVLYALFVLVGLFAFDFGSRAQDLYFAAPFLVPFLAATLVLLVDRITGPPRR